MEEERVKNEKSRRKVKEGVNRKEQRKERNEKKIQYRIEENLDYQGLKNKN